MASEKVKVVVVAVANVVRALVVADNVKERGNSEAKEKVSNSINNNN